MGKGSFTPSSFNEKLHNFPNNCFRNQHFYVAIKIMVFSDSCSDAKIPSLISWTTVVISVVLCIVTVPGNALTCAAIIKDPFKELRSPFNYFVINLAASDLIVGLITEPGFIVYHVHEALEEKKLPILWVVHLTYFVSLTASLLSLSALTVDRCLAIVSPLRRRLNTRRGYITSVVIWSIAFVLPLAYFAFQFYLFLFLFINTAVIVVFIILSVSVKRITGRMRDGVQHWDSVKNSVCKQRAIVRERKVTKSFLMILTLFCCAVFPSCIVAYVINLCSTCSCDVINILRDVYFLLPMMMSTTNQFLYSWRMRNFRTAFSVILKVKSNVTGKLRFNRVVDGNLGNVSGKVISLKYLLSQGV